MLQISKSQLEELSKARLRSFVARAITYARRNLNGLIDQSDEELSSHLYELKVRANSLNIHAERSIVDLYLVTLTHGLVVVQENDVVRFLSDPKANEFVRVRRFVSEFKNA